MSDLWLVTTLDRSVPAQVLPSNQGGEAHVCFPTASSSFLLHTSGNSPPYHPEMKFLDNTNNTKFLLCVNTMP